MLRWFCLWGGIVTENILALSVTYGDSSPKGRAPGETGNFIH